MHRDQDRQRLFTRRMALLAGGKTLLLSALVGRMYYLQVIEADKYKTLAEENRINLKLLPPLRGDIVDRRGVPIADNRQNYRVVLVREQAGDVEQTLDRLGQVVPVADSDKRRILREVRRKRSFVPVTVRENLTWEEVARIEVNAPDLPGISIDEGQSRHYPFPEATAHILGYVAAVAEEDLNGDPLLELPGFRIGKAGVERVYDLPLRGTSGNSQIEVNAFGRVIRELKRTEGQPGSELKLTIDLELQELVTRRLGPESASVVVLDVRSGEVLAMVSVPGFDPNAFNRGLTSEEWQALAGNPKSPLTNKAIAGQYAPGSTFKMVVALAALEKVVITPNTKIFCPGFVKLGDATFHCWKRNGHGLLDLKAGIAQSCDVYFYEVARRTGIDAISAMAKRLGLGQKLAIDLPNEKPGLMPTRDWKLATLGSPWQQGETLISGIGQGYILTTPLQLAVMTARLANGGRAVTPRLIAEGVTAHATVLPGDAAFPSIGVSAANLAIIADAMDAVVNTPYGTARASRIRQPGFAMAGKTGTAQVRRITKAERQSGVRKNEDLPWAERDHALFVAFAPVEAPRFAVSVVVEHGGSGSAVAAPIAQDVMEAVLQIRALPGNLSVEGDPSQPRDRRRPAEKV
ncbi:MAG: penicillin-binding protein 2 [Rhodospirillales bacterium]|jgi:penicillin-binding protein 2|nr:penicillin-binding protein 2 [Rhodospirillales bacterium]